MVYRHLIVFLIAGLLSALAAGYIADAASVYDINLRTYQLHLVSQEQSPQLLHQVNTPNGAIVDMPFSIGGGYTLYFLATLLGNAASLMFLPLMGSFLLGGTLALIAMTAIRTESSLHSLGGLALSILLGTGTAILGLMLGLDTPQVAGIGTLAMASILFSVFLLLSPQGSLLIAGLMSLFGLWLLPQAAPLVGALFLASLTHLHRLPRRQHAFLSLVVTAIAAGALALSYGGASQPYSTDGISLAYPLGYLTIAVITMASGFLPLRRKGWILSLLGFTILFFPASLETPVTIALLALLLSSVALWIWTLRQTATRGLMGRDSAIGMLALGAIITLLLFSQNTTSPLGLAMGWIIMTGGMLAVARTVAYLGFHIAGGWAALGATCVPIMAALAGATLSLVNQPTTITAEQSFLTPQACDPNVIAMISGNAEDLAIHRILAPAQNASQLIQNPNLSIVDIHPNVTGWQSAQDIWMDESQDLETARRTLFRRSIDTILVCGTSLEDETLFIERLWISTAPQWLTLIDQTEEFKLYKIDRDPLETEPTPSQQIPQTQEEPAQ